MRTTKTPRKIARRNVPAQPNVADRVAFTNTDKVWFPEAGITKGNVLEFYRAVAPLLLPHLRDRPITLERLPDGLAPGGPRFWQKNTPRYYPNWIPRVELPTEAGKTVQYTLVNDLDTLLYLVNQGAITFHVWPSRVKSLDDPDFVLFDLDPGKAEFADVTKIAINLHELLSQRKIDSYLKTSGKSGLHVLCAWKQSGGYDAARAWAMGIAEDVVRRLPDLATTKRLKSERDGHVYVDVIQNAKGHHVVPPYVLRAVPKATVSTPLQWKELTPRLDPAQFTMKAAVRRFQRRRNDSMAELVA